VAKQGRLPGTGSKDPVGKAAERYVGVKSERDALNDKLKQAEQALIHEMQMAKRKSIKASGMTLTLNHANAKDSISAKVTRQSEKKKE
jgi:hypothetical protein